MKDYIPRYQHFGFSTQHLKCCFYPSAKREERLQKSRLAEHEYPKSHTKNLPAQINPLCPYQASKEIYHE